MTTTATRPDAGRGRAAIVARTLRTDRWWFPTLITFLGLTAWVIYAVVRVYMHKWYFVEQYHYLTPFYSPCLTDRCVEGASEFGTPLPAWWIIPEAAFSLPFLLLFRLTCYYYRKAYYRAFWLSPPACAVAEPHARYTGETRFPLILQNIHRWFWYAAVVVALILTYDAVLAFGPAEGESDGVHMGLGTVLMVANVVLIWLYTLSCHSCRHITGGRLRHFSRHPVRYRMWTFVSKLNARHGQYAWYSLFSVAIVDFYIYLLATGAFDDPRFF
jgi:hypothetical protein